MLSDLDLQDAKGRENGNGRICVGMGDDFFDGDVVKDDSCEGGC